MMMLFLELESTGEVGGQKVEGQELEKKLDKFNLDYILYKLPSRHPHEGTRGEVGYIV